MSYLPVQSDVAAGLRSQGHVRKCKKRQAGVGSMQHGTQTTGMTTWWVCYCCLSGLQCGFSFRGSCYADNSLEPRILSMLVSITTRTDFTTFSNYTFEYLDPLGSGLDFSLSSIVYLGFLRIQRNKTKCKCFGF